MHLRDDAGSEGGCVAKMSTAAVPELKQISREEAMRLGPGWSHSCHAMLYAANPGQLFGRIPMRFSVLVRTRAAGPGWGRRASPAPVTRAPFADADAL